MNFRRSLAAAVFVFVLTFSPIAHADTASPSGPFADALQFWSAIVTSIEAMAHQFATALIPHQSQLTDNTNPQASKNLNPPPVALNAFEAAVGAALPITATSSQTNSAATSGQTTQSQFCQLSSIKHPGIILLSSTCSGFSIVCRDRAHHHRASTRRHR